jgi:4-amino-4-deoxy-L-arabinose transferase-like glycosyltransferase
MCAGLSYEAGKFPVKQFKLLRYCTASVKSLTRISEIDYRCILNRVLNCIIPLTLFPIFRMHGSDVTIQQQSKPEEQSHNLTALLIALLTLNTLFVLYIFRVYDDNRLISWQWVFANNEVYITGLMLLMGLFLSWWLTGIKLSQKKALILLLCTSFMICSVQWSQPELIVDTSRYFLQAKSIAVNGPAYFIHEWGYGIAAWTDLPLIPFLYGLVFSLVGEYRIAIQIFTTLFFCGTVLLTFLIGRELWDETTGLYGGALLLGMPFLLSQVPLILVDIPTMFFLSLAVYCMLIAVKTGATSWFVMAGITTVLALLCKYSTWLMLSVLIVIAMSYHRGSWAKLSKQMVTLFMGIALFFIVLLLWKYDAIVRQFVLLTTYQLPGLDRWHETHISTFLYQVHPFITLAALSSVYFAWHKRDIRYLIVAWMLLLVLLLEIKRARYVLIVFPMLALMAAYALRQINHSRLRNYMVLCIIVSSLAVTLFGYSSFAHKTSAMNIKHAGEFLNKIKASTVEVILLPQTNSTINPFVSIPLLDLFTTKNLVYWKPPVLTSRPDQNKLSTSPLRFSWEYKLENYYQTSHDAAEKVIVIISNTETQVLPAIVSARLKDFHLKRRFTQHEDVYRYSTIVDVYEASKQRKSVDII